MSKLIQIMPILTQIIPNFAQIMPTLMQINDKNNLLGWSLDFSDDLPWQLTYLIDQRSFLKQQVNQWPAL
jgi:hypothetical protein